VKIFLYPSPWRFNKWRKNSWLPPHPFYLKVDINNFAVFIHGSPKVISFPIDRYKNFVNVKRITMAPVIPSQSARVNSAELYALEPDSLTTNNDPALGQ
jgi:hypothetical protein